MKKYRIWFACTFLIACIYVSYPASAQMSTPDDMERADVATGIFNKACFSYAGKKLEAVSYLDQTFKRNNGSSRQVFLDFAKVVEGDVWIAAFPKGVFAIVVSEDGNCHVLAQKANRERIHTNIKALSEELARDKALTINPLDIKGSATRSTGFDVIKANAKNTTVIASTPVDQGPHKPDAVITMAVSIQ